MNLLAIGNLLFQLGDYAVKAVVHFANTEQGEKEWGDVVAAFVDLDLFNPSDIAQGVSVTRTDSGGSLTVADIERMSEAFNRPEEQAVEKPAASRTIRRPVKPVVNVDEIPF